MKILEKIKQLNKKQQGLLICGGVFLVVIVTIAINLFLICNFTRAYNEAVDTYNKLSDEYDEAL